MTNFRLEEPTIKREFVPAVVPRLNVSFSYVIENHDVGGQIAIAWCVAEGEMAGIPLNIIGTRAGDPMLFRNAGTTNGRGDCQFQIVLSPEFVRKVEAVRKGDLSSVVTVQMTALWLITDPHTNEVRLQPWHVPFQIKLDHSRDQWNELLMRIGYNLAWIVEIPTPGSVLWPEVEKQLKRADDELRAHQTQSAAQACRDAWQAANPYLQERWEDIDEVLRRRSKQLGKYPPLPERIATAYDDISRLLNDTRAVADTAKHGEAHTLSDDDTLLIYRLTHALLAYLSRQAALAEGTKPA